MSTIEDPHNLGPHKLRIFKGGAKVSFPRTYSFLRPAANIGNWRLLAARILRKPGGVILSDLSLAGKPYNVQNFGA